MVGGCRSVLGLSRNITRGVERGDTAHRFLLSPGPRRSRAALGFISECRFLHSSRWVLRNLAVALLAHWLT
jgi:hypothetical protein